MSNDEHRDSITFNPVIGSKVRFLVGESTICNTPLPPYNEEACAFLSDVSSRLLRDSAVRAFPDVASFAYWCRKGNVGKLRKQADEGRYPLSQRLGRGLAFHVAPSNIPVNFAFSFVFALLAGCANIVRVPSKPFAQTRIICDAMRVALPDYPAIKCRTAFVTYGHEDDVTEAFSAMSDARILWGGDRTVEHVKGFPARPRCKDIAFSDRYSVAVIDGAAVEAATDGELSELALRFYNDTYLMDQNACSSPQMVFWHDADADSKRRFWSAVEKVADARYELQAAVVMDKYVQLCSDIIDGVVTEPMDFDGMLTVLDVGELSGDISRLRGKGGYFYEHDIDDLEQLAPFVTERYQTLLYFGCDPAELRSLVIDNRLRGIDRIVPFGSAMDIDIIWDGCDLVTELSRIVDAR